VSSSQLNIPISQLTFQIVDYSSQLLYITRKLMPAQSKQENEVLKAKLSFQQLPREVTLKRWVTTA